MLHLIYMPAWVTCLHVTLSCVCNPSRAVTALAEMQRQALTLKKLGDGEGLDVGAGLVAHEVTHGLLGLRRDVQLLEQGLAQVVDCGG